MVETMRPCHPSYIPTERESKPLEMRDLNHTTRKDRSDIAQPRSSWVISPKTAVSWGYEKERKQHTGQRAYQKRHATASPSTNQQQSYLPISSQQSIAASAPKVILLPRSCPDCVVSDCKLITAVMASLSGRTMRVYKVPATGKC